MIMKSQLLLLPCDYTISFVITQVCRYFVSVWYGTCRCCTRMSGTFCCYLLKRYIQLCLCRNYINKGGRSLNHLCLYISSHICQAKLLVLLYCKVMFLRLPTYLQDWQTVVLIVTWSLWPNPATFKLSVWNWNKVFLTGDQSKYRVLKIA